MREAEFVAPRRNIIVWYLLSVVTLGIAAIVWYYLLNADAKKLALTHRKSEAQARGWSPGLSVVAVTLGALIVVPYFVSMWGTWSRVREATDSSSMGAGLQFLFIFIPIVNVAYSGILQHQINNAVAEVRIPALAPSEVETPASDEVSAETDREFVHH